MRHTIILSISILLLFTACGDNNKSAQEQAAITEAAKAEKDALLKELKAKDIALQKAIAEAKEAKTEAFLKLEKEKRSKAISKDQKFSKVGIHIEENTITIDTNKTKYFFKNIGKTINDKLRKITSELEKGMLDEKEAGVHIDESKINIDFNKTKDFLDNWSKKMQGFVKEFDTMSKDLETQPQIKTH